MPKPRSSPTPDETSGSEKGRASRRMACTYPEPLEQALRRLSKRSGVPLARLKAIADGLVEFPSTKEVWKSYLEQVDSEIPEATAALDVNPFADEEG